MWDVSLWFAFMLYVLVDNCRHDLQNIDFEFIGNGSEEAKVLVDYILIVHAEL